MLETKEWFVPIDEFDGIDYRDADKYQSGQYFCDPYNEIIYKHEDLTSDNIKVVDQKHHTINYITVAEFEKIKDELTERIEKDFEERSKIVNQMTPEEKEQDLQRIRQEMRKKMYEQAERKKKWYPDYKPYDWSK